MEIERKYLVKQLPEKLSTYPHRLIEQGYLSTEPVIRIRKDGDKYELTYKSKGLMIREEYNLPLTQSSYEHFEQGYLSTEPVIRIRKDGDKYELTYKSKGLMIREEYNLPLTQSSYEHLKPKTDGYLITKERYNIPYHHLTIELDCFLGQFSPLILAEVEFPDEESANAFVPPDWFGEDVTFSPAYQNSSLDCFLGQFSPLILAEVEFPDEESANAFVPPDWFGEDVTFSPAYQNSSLSQKGPLR